MPNMDGWKAAVTAEVDRTRLEQYDDVDRDDPLIAHRIPVTTTARWRPYLATFYRDSAARPTEAETVVLASYIDYLRAKWNQPHVQKQMLKQPLDLDPGINTVMFRKTGEDAWLHHYDTWQIGPYWQPGGPPDGPASPLVQVIDRAERSERWEQWKTEHPDLFPEATS